MPNPGRSFSNVHACLTNLVHIMLCRATNIIQLGSSLCLDRFAYNINLLDRRRKQEKPVLDTKSRDLVTDKHRGCKPVAVDTHNHAAKVCLVGLVHAHNVTRAQAGGIVSAVKKLTLPASGIVLGSNQVGLNGADNGLVVDERFLRSG